MEPTIFELCCIAGAIYGDADVQALAGSAAAAGWTPQSPFDGSYGFRAGAFRRGPYAVVAFRGTTGNVGDWTADALLSLGMNTSHFAQGEAYLSRLQGTESVILCGHSLGGAIAQVVGNRAKLPFATFNAPGVAVFASRNIATANIGALATRAAGSILSAIVSPGQAAKDIASAFYKVRGVNVCLLGDPVSHVGVHYGKVARINGLGHGISTVAGALQGAPIAQTTISSYFPA